MKKYRSDNYPKGIYVFPVFQKESVEKYVIVCTSKSSEEYRHMNGHEFEKLDHAESFILTAINTMRYINE